MVFQELIGESLMLDALFWIIGECEQFNVGVVKELYLKRLRIGNH